MLESDPPCAGFRGAPGSIARLPPVSWRILETGPGEAAWNMALDEALLEGFDAARDRPLLRLYRWRPAAISLGRFQPAADVTPPPGVALVRRLSGGAAIHHREDELTYSVVAPYRLFGSRSPRAAYAAIHGLLARALALLGVPAPDGAGGADGPAGAGLPDGPDGADGTSGPGGARGAAAVGAASARPERPAPLRGMCFAHATSYDLTVGGRKLIGSAQRRRGDAFLQHGALPLSPDPATPGATSLATLLGAAPAPDAVAAAVRAALAELARDVVEGPPTAAEQARALELRAARYDAARWTRTR